jgi:signal transduction histidine kinase
VLRIVQESVRNAVRHAKATAVALALACEGDTIALSIVDDGVGIPSERQDAAHGGLRNIHARAGSLGGSARLESSDRGTRWTIAVPLRRGAQA